MNNRDEAGIIECRAYSLPFDDIDTDQIFPAEFLATTSQEGLGRFCFHYWRVDESGNPIEDNPLSAFDPHRHQVLVAGRNFGCGSSREHAPWALLDMGVRAVISSRFADIFYSNALKNGLLPVILDKEAVDFLHRHADQAVRIDIPARTIEIEGYGCAEFPLDAFAGHCITEGIDQMDFLMQQEHLIAEYERSRERDGRA